MNKNILFAGVAVIILIVFGGIYFNRPASPPAPVSAPTTTSASVQTEIDLTDQGFSPSTITVKQGATVNFVNKSSGQMWVASNPHPIHTDYPGFDQGSDGDNYAFTFQKVGTWGFHNHLTPSVKGQIIVEP